MEPDAIPAGLIPLRERVCQFADCHKIFYVCRSCDHGRRYCSPLCRASARNLQHRAASARYQRTLFGACNHAKRQQAYRQRQRARRALPENKVTAPCFPADDSASSCKSEVPQPASQPPIPPPAGAPTSHPRQVSPGGLRCQFCHRPGYLPKRDAHEPDYSGRYP
jgi:hypothetical protein